MFSEIRVLKVGGAGLGIVGGDVAFDFWVAFVGEGASHDGKD